MKKLITLALLLILTSCCSVDVHFQAVKSYEQSVGAEYLEYVNQDNSLTVEQKKDRSDAVEQFRSYLEAWERAR